MSLALDYHRPWFHYFRMRSLIRSMYALFMFVLFAAPAAGELNDEEVRSLMTSLNGNLLRAERNWQSDKVTEGLREFATVLDVNRHLQGERTFISWCLRNTYSKKAYTSAYHYARGWSPNDKAALASLLDSTPEPPPFEEIARWLQEEELNTMLRKLIRSAQAVYSNQWVTASREASPPVGERNEAGTTLESTGQSQPSIEGVRSTSAASSLADRIRLSAIVDHGDELQIGLEFSDGQSCLLRPGQEACGALVLRADYDQEQAVILYLGEMAVIDLKSRTITPFASRQTAPPRAYTDRIMDDVIAALPPEEAELLQFKEYVQANGGTLEARPVPMRMTVGYLINELIDASRLLNESIAVSGTMTTDAFLAWEEERSRRMTNLFYSACVYGLPQHKERYDETAKARAALRAVLDQ